MPSRTIDFDIDLEDVLEYIEHSHHHLGQIKSAVEQRENELGLSDKANETLDDALKRELFESERISQKSYEKFYQQLHQMIIS